MKPSKIGRQIWLQVPRKKVDSYKLDVHKRGHYCGIVHNESSIKISKPKKTLNIINKSWGNLVHNVFNLAKIHAHTIFKNDVVEEFHFYLMEFTFLRFGIKWNFLLACPKQVEMVFMLCQVLGENEDVINVTNYEIIEIFTKQSFMRCWKMASAFISPKCITTYLKWS